MRPVRLLGSQQRTLASNLQPDYSEAEALRRFGADILTLERQYIGLDTEGRTAWRAANAAAYARLKQLWDFKYGPQTGTGSPHPGVAVATWVDHLFTVAVDGAVVEVAAERRHQRRSRRCPRCQRRILVG